MNTNINVNTDKHKLFSLCLHGFAQKYLCKSVFSSVFICVIVLICVLTPFELKAAVLYLKPASGEYYQGDTFLVEVWLDTEGEEINTVQVSLNYPSLNLEGVNFSDGGSILILWPEKPDLREKGGINFIGGVPGGFNGQGSIGKIIFRAVSADSAEVNFRDGTKVLLNDGLGTPAALTTQGAEFKILPQARTVPKNEWEEELRKDTIPPEPFEIAIYQDPKMFGGKHFIVFSTLDKQTGLDYFEIKEGEKDWKRGVSPYLLEDQGLKNKILVKAVDKAGNERIVEFIPPYKISWRDIVIPLLILIGIGIIWRVVRKIKNKKSNIKK